MTLEEQFKVLFYSFIYGMFFLSSLRIFNLIKVKKRVVKFMLEMLFVLSHIIIFYLLLYKINYGSLSFYIFLSFIIGLSVISSIDNVIKIGEKKKEKRELTKQLETLKEDETTLTDDVDKLKNPEYAARYAREKYLYSKNGEKILKID